MSFDSLFRKIKKSESGEIIFSQADYDAEIAEAVKLATEKMVPVDDFQKLAKDHKEALKNLQTTHAGELTKVKQTYGLQSAMQGVKAKKGYETLLDKLIDREKIQYDEEGKVVGGLDDQVKALQETYADIFEVETGGEPTPPPIKGAPFVNTPQNPPANAPTHGTGLRGALAEVFK